MKSGVLVLVVLLLLGPVALAGEKQVEQKLAAAKVTLELKDQPLEEVLRAISKAAGVPIVVDPKVYQSMPAARLKVTLKVAQLSADKALQLVLDMTGLESTIAGDVVRVGDRRGRPLGATGQAHYVGDLMQVIRDFAGPRLGLVPAYPDRLYGGSPVYGGLRRTYYDETYVPLGVPHYEDPPSFSQPLYRDRDSQAPWKPQAHAGGLSDPVRLIARLQAMTGGEQTWERPGVGMRLARGGRLWVVHTPAVQAKVAAAIVKLRASR